MIANWRAKSGETMIFWNTLNKQVKHVLAIFCLLALVALVRPQPIRAVTCPADDPNCCIGTSICDDPEYSYVSLWSQPASETCDKTKLISTYSGPGLGPQMGYLSCSSDCYSIFTNTPEEDFVDPTFVVACYQETGAPCSYPQNCGPNQTGKQMCAGEFGTVNGVVGCQASECTPCAYCGNGACEVGEGADNCAADCGQPAEAVCGDGYCSASEYTVWKNCPADCDPIVKTGQCRYRQQCTDRENQWQVCTGSNAAGTSSAEGCGPDRDIPANCSPCSTSGNQRCEIGERENGLSDCDNPLPPVCGNNLCEEGEDLQCRDCTAFAGLGVGETGGSGGAGISCGWEIRDDSSFRLCFSSNDYYNLSQGEVKFFCENVDGINNCGGVLMQALYSLYAPSVKLDDGIGLNPSTGEDSGRYYACFDGNFDTNKILNVAINNIKRSCYQQLTVDFTKFLLITRIVPTSGAGGIVGTLLNAPRTIAQVATLFDAGQDILGVGGSKMPACFRSAINDSFGYKAEFDKDDLSCEARLQFQYSNPEIPDVIEPGEDYNRSGSNTEASDSKKTPIAAFGYCQQVPEGNQRAACESCLLSGGAEISSHGNLDPKDTIYTAVGCLNITQSGLAADLIRLILGIAGGLALLFILVAAFTFSTSRGDSNKIKTAREQITAAVAGLFFIIFSIIVLNFIGVQILRIPGLS